jgi:ketosteroid isomerase-like protein
VRILRGLVVLFAVMAFAGVVRMQAQDESKQTKEILAVLDKQGVDWNRGDMDAFAAGYKNSPDILFMGSPIAKGYAQMVERYHTVYPTAEKRGVLTFTEVEVQPLDERFATVTGRFHLERTVAGGGNADGYYLLVMEKTAEGWKIIRDASSASPKVATK